jgi:hypothetical protein
MGVLKRNLLAYESGLKVMSVPWICYYTSVAAFYPSSSHHLERSDTEDSGDQDNCARKEP